MLLFTLVLLALFSPTLLAQSSPTTSVTFSYIPKIHIGNTKLVNKLVVQVDGQPVTDPIRAFAQLLRICNGNVAYSAAVAINNPFTVPVVAPPSICILSAVYDDGVNVPISTDFPFSVVPFSISGRYLLDGSDLITTFNFNYQ